jgi:hypothetical protein
MPQVTPEDAAPARWFLTPDERGNPATDIDRIPDDAGIAYVPGNLTRDEHEPALHRLVVLDVEPRIVVRTLQRIALSIRVLQVRRRVRPCQTHCIEAA